MFKLIVAASLAFNPVAPVVAQGEPVEQPSEGPAADPASPAQEEASEAAVIADCSARKFETSVELEKDGKKRLTRLKLCSTSQSDASSWVRTLEDAKAKIAAHPDISEDSKATISKQIDAEIAKVAVKPQQ